MTRLSRWRILLGSFLLLSAPASALQCEYHYSPLYGRCVTSITEATEDFRLQAGQAFAKGDTAHTRELLGKAEESAARITDPYTRVNQSRYLAQLWHQLGEVEKSRTLFSAAMQLTPKIRMVERRFSAVIGVVELQKASGDAQGTRANTRWALESGILEAQAKTGKAGEAGRFLTNLKRVLTPADIQRIIQHTYPLPLYDMRLKIWRKLAFQDFAPPPYAETLETIRTTSTPEVLEGDDRLESLALLCIRARQFAAYGDTPTQRFYQQRMNRLVVNAAEQNAAEINELRSWQRNCTRTLEKMQPGL